MESIRVFLLWLNWIPFSLRNGPGHGLMVRSSGPMKPKRSWVSKTKMMPGFKLGVNEYFFGDQGGWTFPPKKDAQHLGLFLKDEEGT